MNRFHKYIVTGISIGLIDVIPMILLELPWSVIISSWSMWVIISIIVYSSTLKFNHIVKSIVIAVLVFIPNALVNSWNTPLYIIPALFMTVILGGIMGLITRKIDTP